MYIPSVVSAPTSSEADAIFRTMMEANLSSEVALVVLDVVSLYTTHFKVRHLIEMASFIDKPGFLIRILVNDMLVMDIEFSLLLLSLLIRMILEPVLNRDACIVGKVR